MQLVSWPINSTLTLYKMLVITGTGNTSAVFASKFEFNNIKSCVIFAAIPFFAALDSHISDLVFDQLSILTD